MKKEVKRSIISIILVTVFLVTMTTFVYLPKKANLMSSLAFLNNQKRFYMTEVTSGILLHDATPVSDKKGLENDPYVFKVVNTSNKDINYKIVFKNNEDKAISMGKEVLPNKYLKYSINEINTDITVNNLTSDGTIYTGIIPKNSEITFEFRMWLDYNADNGAMNKVFVGNIVLVEM